MKAAYILNAPNAATIRKAQCFFPNWKKKDTEQKGMLLLICDQCVIQRRLATGEAGDAKPMNLVDGVTVGCFPELYEALEPNPPDQVISL